MASAVVTDLLDILDQLSGGVHHGFRPAHAKGLMCVGTFSPSPEASDLTRATCDLRRFVGTARGRRTRAGLRRRLAKALNSRSLE